MDVVIELPPKRSEGLPPGSRAAQIDYLKAIFDEASTPVRDQVEAVGGSVVDEAWINQTLRAQIPAGSLDTLSDALEGCTIDVPHAIEPES